MLRSPRRAQVVAFCIVVALLAAGGAGYLVWHRSDRAPTHIPTAPVAIRSPALAGLADTAAVPTATSVAAALARPTTAAALGGALEGLVVDARTGAVLFARDARRANPPASTVKLLTAAAALGVLGPTARLSTQVLRSGSTLYLVGGGDVTLTVKRLQELARRTAHSVGPGNLRLRYDVSRWSGPSSAPGWNDGYFTAGDVTRLSPLEIADSDRDAAAVTAVFAAALEHAGVRVRGAVAQSTSPADATAVAAVTSAPVEALVEDMLTVSDNNLAEALGRAVAIDGGGAGSFAGEAAALRRAIDALNLPTDGLELYDGSGLSRLDRVTPRLLVALLRRAVDDDVLRPLIVGLPVAGLTGTLTDRYRRGVTHVAAGIARAKTGTLAGVSAIAGQVVDADGRLLLFAFLTDHASDPTNAEQALDAVVARLSTCGCDGGG